MGVIFLLCISFALAAYGPSKPASSSDSGGGGSSGSSGSSSSSGGGGGGGGSSSGSITATPQLEKKSWISINAGETTSMPITNEEIAVSEISFTVVGTAKEVWVQVEKVDRLPSAVSGFKGETYRTIKITEQNLKNGLQGEAKIKFNVEKSWLLEHNVDKSSIALFRYFGERWMELPTTYDGDDGALVHYTAATAGFSYFVLGVKEATEETTALKTSPETTLAESTATPEEFTEEGADNLRAETTWSKVLLQLSWLWVSIIIIFIGLGIAVYISKHKEGFPI